jgi:hypothetical protein
MRSNLIFEVSPRFSNRYQLCRMLASSVRKMHRDGASTAQSINQSLQALQDASTGASPSVAALPPESDATGALTQKAATGSR